MKFLTSLFTITAKLMLLACFVSMNGNCATVEAKVSPCHVKAATHQEMKYPHPKGCEQCGLSQQSWSTPATLQHIPSEKLLPVWQTPVLFLNKPKFSELLEEISPTRAPPNELFSNTFSRIFRATRWRSSGR